MLVPRLPPELLRRHACHEPTDTRYRAAARLAQALWRESRGLAAGRYRDAATGRWRRLGSRFGLRPAAAGANLVDSILMPLIRRELAYCEPGAAIDERRLWQNMLSSQALAFSLFGPLKLNLALATAVLSRLAPDIIGVVNEIVFEHSPGRGDTRFTGDRTAFDVLVRCTTPTGRSAFLAIEVKYTEAPGGVGVEPCPRYDELSRQAGVFIEPNAPTLRSGALNQFWRQQLLATAMLRNGLYEQGRVVVLAPLPNRQACRATALYASHLVSLDPAEARFQALTLELFVSALAEAGAEPLADLIAERYLDFRPADAALQDALAA
ncbi:hypothetical protein D9598_19950 [Roseomonas sp. KE0001]|nr:hypothetical protein [Roseomonas sp. KE0001]